MKNTDIYTQNLVFRLIMIVAVPIFSLIMVYNIYTFFTLTQSTLATGEEHAVKLQAELDEKTALIDSYIINEAVSNDFSVLCYSSNLLNRNISLANIINRFGQKIQDISEIAGLLIISDNFCRERYNSYIDYCTSSALKNYARELPYESSAWTYDQINDTDYFVYVYNKEHIKIVCFFSIIQLFQEYESSAYETHICTITNDENTAVFQSPDTPAINFLNSSENAYSRIVLSDVLYLYVSKPSLHTNYTVHILICFKDLISNVSILQGLILILSVLLLLTIPLYFFLVKHFYLIPLKQLTMDILNMKQNSKIQYLNNTYNIHELTLFQNSLNDLLSTIEQLNDKYYKKELESQKVQLHFLQLQLKPHFYLNCLKQIYSLLNQHKYHDASEAILSLANYLRYILKDDSHLISLSEELDCIKNYISLRNIGSTKPILFDYTFDQSLNHCEIPMLLLETFVENAIKYGQKADTQLVISMECFLLDDATAQKIYFRIQDNGIGFSENQLQIYNAGPNTNNLSHGIGILNIMQRCKILYEGKEFFHFSNQNGATIEIIIPCSDY